MTDPLTVQEKITEATFAIRQAVKIDSGRRAMEGDIESAYHRLVYFLRKK